MRDRTSRRRTVSQWLSRRIRWVLAAIGLIVWATTLACSGVRGQIPPRFCGTFAFDNAASIAYWEAQSDWPRATKDSLKKMALPTELRIEPNQVVITDIATGKATTEAARIAQVGADFIELNLRSNFAGTSRVTRFQFDADGFWLLEGTLFPNYRERFKRMSDR
jgi:hypothetical protein